MRNLFVSTLIYTVTLSGVSAQQPVPAQGSNWSRVQSLPSGTNLSVKVAKHTTHCVLQTVDADALTCAPALPATPATFQRSDILSIKIPHRGRSTLVAAAPGVVLMAAGGIGAATAKCSNTAILCGVGGAALLVLGVAVTLIGIPVGYFTDFTASTVYRRP